MRKLLTFVMLMMVVATQAKDIKTLVVTTQPQMHCESCEKTIKGNLRFEKGVKKIETNIPEQLVTITYDADKTTSDAIIQSFNKFGYKASEVNQDKKEDGNEDGHSKCKEGHEQCASSEHCQSSDGKCHKSSEKCKSSDEKCKSSDEKCHKTSEK